MDSVRRIPARRGRDDLPHSDGASGHPLGAPSSSRATSRRVQSPFAAQFAGTELPLTMPDVELTLPARAENVAVVRHAIGGLGGALGLHPQTPSGGKLAGPQARPNRVVHAHHRGGGPPSVPPPRAPGPTPP